MAAGAQLGGWVMMFLGLKMVAEGLTETFPRAMTCYADGFRAAWGPDTGSGVSDRHTLNPAASEKMAAYRFADGHVLMAIGMLIALVFYLTKGGDEEALLLKAVRGSKCLGPKVADWLEKNKEILKNHPALQRKTWKRELPEDSSPEPRTISRRAQISRKRPRRESPERYRKRCRQKFQA